MSRLTICFLILSSYAPATGQASPQALRTLLTAKTVLIVCEADALHPCKAEQTFKEALVKWGRFQLVDDAKAADLIMAISEYSSSKPTRMERVLEQLTIFIGRSTTPYVDTEPLWAVQEVGPALGQRPTNKLVGDLRIYLTVLEKSVRASAESPRDIN